MFKFLQQLMQKPAGGPDWQRIYEINKIEKTFGVSFEQFQANPWNWLGKPPPEIQALWDRPHALLPSQRRVAASFDEAVQQPAEEEVFVV